MKKFYSLLLIIFTITFASAQVNIYNNGFETTAGWVRVNVSTPNTTNTWNIPTAPVAGYFDTGSQAGTALSYYTAGKQSTTGTGTISNWLVSPNITVKNGDVVSFYTRTGANTTTRADRLQLRMSTNGTFSNLPTLNANDVGDYINLLLDINPIQTLLVYPNTWTKYTATISGLTGPTACKFAFRYYVTNGGPTSLNSDLIGVDTFSVDEPNLTLKDFFEDSFTVYPNPTSEFVNLNSKNNEVINSIKLIDINGRIVKENIVNATAVQFSISDLNNGIYFLKVNSNEGILTAKIIKK